MDEEIPITVKRKRGYYIEPPTRLTRKKSAMTGEQLEEGELPTGDESSKKRRGRRKRGIKNGTNKHTPVTRQETKQTGKPLFDKREFWKQKNEEEQREEEQRKEELKKSKSGPHQRLWWDTPKDFVPYASEEAIIGVLMKAGQNERGMMKDQPHSRLKEIQEQLETLGDITLEQALSLRRHHIRKLNPRPNMKKLGLGLDKDINLSARLFEECVDDFLRKCNIEFLTETEQRELGKPCTPDFLLKQPVLLQKVRRNGYNKVVLEERKIHWIEAKMFYGASTIEHGDAGAVGSIRTQVKRYVDVYGEGAIVFYNGCGDRLASEFADMGISVLDCFGPASVNIGRALAHQKKWCGKKGQILN